MADWSKPLLTDLYTDFLQFIKDRDSDLATMFDVGSPSNLEDKTVRWNSTNKRFEKWNTAGSSWGVLETFYSINVDQVDGKDVGHASGNIPLSDGTVNTNLNADFLDGYDGTNFLGKNGGSNYAASTNIEWGTNTQGLLWPSNTGNGATALVPVSSADSGLSFGSMKLTGGKGGYSGFVFPSTTNNRTFMVNNSSGLGGVYQQNGGSSAWDWYYDPTLGTFKVQSGAYKVWHENNDGSGSGLDADLVDGYNVSEAATNSTVAARTSAGYLYASYLNQSSSSTENPTAGAVFVESGADGFLRKASMDNFKLQLGAMQYGQCRIDYTGPAQIKLLRYNGKYIFINGKWEVVPSGGVAMSNSGLSASSTYFIYAYMSGGTMTLEASTTNRALDGTYGHFIKNGDATRTLVGMVHTNASTQFSDDAANRLVISWFNRQPRELLYYPGGDVGITAAPWVQIYPTLYATFMHFNDGGRQHFRAHYSCYTDTAAVGMYLSIAINDSLSGATHGSAVATGSGYSQCLSASWEGNVPEGYNWLQLYGGVGSGANMTFMGAYGNCSGIVWV